LDRAQILTGLSRGLFPWRHNEIAKRYRWCLVGAKLEHRLKRSITVDPTVVSWSNFHRSFKRLVFVELQSNHQETPVVSRRARLEYRLYRSLTLDPTVGLCSNFYKSLWRLFSLASH
jgi:hypothetical protein